MRNRIQGAAAVLLLGALAGLWPSGAARAQQRTEVVDGVAAVVNGLVVTLVDVRIAEAFGLVESGPAATPEEKRCTILERLIDRKVVIDLARERSSVDPAKVSLELGRLLARIGRVEAKARLDAFGLEADDLRPYLEEAILSETIVANRFDHGAGVSLREIEAYYAETYVPAQVKLGRTPPPMIDVLDALEAQIQSTKSESQAALWIKNLRMQADIEIRAAALK
jgi:hypothetical protein